MIRVVLGLIFITGFLLALGEWDEGPVSGQVSGSKIRNLPVSCRACLPVTVYFVYS